MSTTERIVGRPWNQHEDSLLKQAVAIHGENDNWKIVALSVPGRTNKACRKVSIISHEQQLNMSLYVLAVASLSLTNCQENCLDTG
jgi:hypothetical protein